MFRRLQAAGLPPAKRTGTTALLQDIACTCGSNVDRSSNITPQSADKFWEEDILALDTDRDTFNPDSRYFTELKREDYEAIGVMIRYILRN